MLRRRLVFFALLALSAWAQAQPPRPSTGIVPLPDLGAASYQGEQGGLYPGGRNIPPARHLDAGLKLARAIVPLDGEGKPSDAGRIVLLSIGMSNTTQEFTAFQQLAAKETGINPKLALVDGAQNAQTAHMTADAEANFWRVVDQRLSAAGVTGRQVEIVWLKQANAQPTAAFPAEAKRLQADIVATLHNLHDRFPNLKIAYLSSRIYGGYASTPLNPEPHAFETAFAVKWAIADQIAGRAEVNFDPAEGKVRSPWIAWGPYLWADGTKGRKQDALVYLREDFAVDGTHPSDSGRRKVAQQLLGFFKTDATAAPWFLAQASSPLQKLSFLLGKWTAMAGDKETPLGAGKGEFTFELELNQKIIVRHNYAEYATAPRHDDLMVIYLDPPGDTPRAIYFDSEGHIIRYNLSFPGPDHVVFESDGGQPGPRYRLSYGLDQGALKGKFEVSPPGQQYNTYMSWSSRRN
jgi:hypothetical protein